MNDIIDITKSITRLWRLYKQQESLFRLGMSLNTSFELRKVFSSGYMMTLLFKKDIDAMYQTIKNNLRDGDLSSIVRNMDGFDPESANEQEVLSMLASQQQMILEAYRQLMSKLDHGSEAAHCCDEHIERLSHFESVLSRELEERLSEEPQSYFSVA